MIIKYTLMSGSQLPSSPRQSKKSMWCDTVCTTHNTQCIAPGRCMGMIHFAFVQNCETFVTLQIRSSSEVPRWLVSACVDNIAHSLECGPSKRRWRSEAQSFIQTSLSIDGVERRERSWMSKLIVRYSLLALQRRGRSGFSMDVPGL